MRILSALGAASEAQQNQTERSRKRRGAKAADMFIFRAMGASQPAGVYERKSDGTLLELLKYVPRQRYQPRLNFGEVVTRTANREFPSHLQAAIAHMLTKQGRPERNRG